MRALLLGGFILLSFFASAQRIEEGYDFNFKPTQHVPRYFVVTEKKDSLWYREAYYWPERSSYLEASYKDKEGKIPHGTENIFFTNKRLKSTGSYRNGKKEGIWLHYNEDGWLRDSFNYTDGRLVGTSLSWYSDGMLADSMVFDGKGNGVDVGFHSTGKVSHAGRWEQDTLKKGKWQYFDDGGNLIREETYSNGELAKRTCYNPDQTVMDTALCNREDDSEFPGGVKNWQNFLVKNLRSQVPIKNKAPAGTYTIIVQFIVGKDGELEDIKPQTSFGYGMEEEVIRLMKKSPKWKPAFQFGKHVKSYKRQPVTFVVMAE